MNQRLRLLIVDDSPLMRRTLRTLLESDSSISVIGEATNGQEALQQVAELRPDVITMDIHMPVMDGLETIERLMAYYPTPILVITSLRSYQDVDITFKMLGAGALDVVEKPTLTDSSSLSRIHQDLIRRVKLLSRVKVVTHLRGRRHIESLEHNTRKAPTDTMRTVFYAPDSHQGYGSPSLRTKRTPPTSVVVIGASTGGPRILQQILSGLPPSFSAAILIVQHIAEGFCTGLTEWLASSCTLPVRLATEGIFLEKGMVFVAPTNNDLMIQPRGILHLNTVPLLLQRPSIDITMQSVAEIYGHRSIGVLLTGMGRDGAVGMKSIRHAGGYTIAQNEITCTIYGMPRAAIELNAVDVMLSPEEIILELQRRVHIKERS